MFSNEKHLFYVTNFISFNNYLTIIKEKKLNIEDCEAVITKSKSSDQTKITSKPLFLSKKTKERITNKGISKMVDEKNGNPEIAIVINKSK